MLKGFIAPSSGHQENPAAVVHVPGVRFSWIYKLDFVFDRIRTSRDPLTDCFGNGYSGDPNEDFNIRWCRPGQGVISPPGASHHREHRPGGKVGEYRRRQLGALLESCFIHFQLRNARPEAPEQKAAYSLIELVGYSDFLENFPECIFLET